VMSQRRVPLFLAGRRTWCRAVKHKVLIAILREMGCHTGQTDGLDSQVIDLGDSLGCFSLLSRGTEHD